MCDVGNSKSSTNSCRDGEDDYYDKQDFSYENFLFLPPGESETFFDPGVREEATCEIDFKEEYVTH